jgi:lysophospholipid acyltransferase (LPLAT)-like uncharacterized protein
MEVAAPVVPPARRARPSSPNLPDTTGEQIALPLGARIRVRGLALLAWAVASVIAATSRLTAKGLAPIEQGILKGEAYILVTWHGRTLLPVWALRRLRLWAIISLSRDGEIQANVFRLFGWRAIRGSTRRGAVRALIQAVRVLQSGGSLAFTPDGPRGPSQKVQPGTVFLAQHSGSPIVPVGVAARPRMLVKSWDRYMVPAPFARSAMVLGEPMSLARDASDAEVAAFTERLALRINELEADAERLVGGDAGRP